MANNKINNRIESSHRYKLDFPGGSVIKNLLTVQETQEIRVRSLGGEDHLEEELTTHSSILAWRIPWTGEPGEIQSIRSQRVGLD